MKNKGDRPLIKAVGRLSDPRVSPREPMNKSQKHLLVAMVGYADPSTEVCFPGVDNLSRDTGYSTRHVKRALTDLREMGFIKRVDPSRVTGERTRTADTYRVNVEFIWEVALGRCALPVVQVQVTFAEPWVTSATGLGDTMSPQETKKKPYLQETTIGGTFEKEWVSSAIEFGLPPDYVKGLVGTTPFMQLENALNDVRTWKNVHDPIAAFKSALKRADVCKLNVPAFPDDSDGSKLQSWAVARDLPAARPGMSCYEYRASLKEEIRSGNE